jgi:hypothetical protein
LAGHFGALFRRCGGFVAATGRILYEVAVGVKKFFDRSRFFLVGVAALDLVDHLEESILSHGIPHQVGVLELARVEGAERGRLGEVVIDVGPQAVRSDDQAVAGAP